MGREIVTLQDILQGTKSGRSTTFERPFVVRAQAKAGCFSASAIKLLDLKNDAKLPRVDTLERSEAESLKNLASLSCAASRLTILSPLETAVKLEDVQQFEELSSESPPESPRPKSLLSLSPPFSQGT